MPPPRPPSRGSSPSAGVQSSWLGTRWVVASPVRWQHVGPTSWAPAVLEDPAWRDPADRVQPPEVVRERIADCRAFADDPRGQLEKGRADNPTWPEAELAPWVEAKSQVDLDFLGLGIANLLEPWDHIVGAISVPTLVLLAERGGPVLPEVRERAARIGNPHLEIRVVPGAGHCIRRDDPAAYHALVDPFLADHG